MVRGSIGCALFALLCSCIDKPALVGRLCSNTEPCPDGLVCRDSSCVAPCIHDQDCEDESEACIDGACLPLTALCSNQDECNSPSVCELAEGARCSGGVCAYRVVECNAPPAGECLENDSVFRTYSSIGACSADDGLCGYVSRETACPNCTTTCLDSCATLICNENNGGCRSEGFCAPGANGGPPSCDYQNVPDGTSCALPGSESRGVCLAGECVGCNTSADCDDHDACTVGPGTCTSGGCDFGSRITCNISPGECFESAGECDPQDGSCHYAPKLMGTACGDDGNSCTLDVCDGGGACTHPPKSDGSACRDGDSCNGTEACMGGACVPSNGVACNAPPSECYAPAGSCDAATGQCTYTASPVDTPCSDDGNTCTSDVCDGFGLCVHRPVANGASCDDGDACTRTDTCASGACRGTNPIVCSGSPGQCYAANGVCDPFAGTCNYPPLPSGTSCNDNNLCSSNDDCNGAGICSGNSYSCSDQNACTTDACDGSGGCSHTAIAPAGLSATQNNDHEIMRWNTCADALHYDVNIEEQDSSGNWFFYFTYDENNPTAPSAGEKSFYPVRCNKQMRFRVRSYNGATHGPWSPFFQFFFSC